MPNGTVKEASPFEIVTPGRGKRVGNKGLIVAVLVVIFLILSVVAGVLLVRQQQDVRERAQASRCPAAEACPVAGQPSLLNNCHPGESDGSPTGSNCDTAGRVEFCGTRNYCCPAAGAAWTTNLTACATPSPTPTPSPSPTPTQTPSPSPTSGGSAPGATPTRTPTVAPTSAAQTTPLPIPETGTGWPTILGAGVGILVIIASVLIAL